MGHELKNNCKEQAEAPTDDLEKHFMDGADARAPRQRTITQ